MRIEGLGVIDEATLDLHPGLTVVTGETGAGKTMVVTGLQLLAGGRADASRVRRGADRAIVEGRFRPASGSPAADLASEVGARIDEDGSLIASRTLTVDGRSRAHLGGRSVPAGVLAELADGMLAVHGQNDQLRLLRSGEQRAVLDRFAGDVVLEALSSYRGIREQWLRCGAELATRRENSRELAREADLLGHSLAEITAVDPQPGEDSALLAEARRLADVDQLRETAALAQAAVCGAPDCDSDQPSAIDLVGQARRRLQAESDPQLRALGERLGEAAAVLGDVAAELSGYLETLNADPARLEQVLGRQADLKRLTRKYGADVDGVLAWARQAHQRLAGLDTSEEAIAALATRRAELATALARHATALTAARTAAARALGDAVTAELAGLAMGQAQLSVAVNPTLAADGDDAALTIAGTPTAGRPGRRRRGGAAPGGAPRRRAAAGAQGRLWWRAVPGDAGAGGGAGRCGPGTDDGLRRGRRWRGRAGRGRDRAAAGPARPQPPGCGGNPPGPGRCLCRSTPRGGQGNLRHRVDPQRGSGAR